MSKRAAKSGGGKHVPALALNRLRKEYKRLQQAPPDHIDAHPLESNMLEWHYCVTLPPSHDSVYAGGAYHGRLVFAREYPYKPPAIYMTTPSGRFKTDTRLCLSMSDYHPETWNPLWSVASILSGLLSFMLETTPTLGSIDDTSDADKRAFAKASMTFNLKSKRFCELFPDIVDAHAAAATVALSPAIAAAAPAKAATTAAAAAPSVTGTPAVDTPAPTAAAAAAATAAAAFPHPELAPGTRVTLHGLRARADLNGVVAVVMAFASAAERTRSAAAGADRVKVTVSATATQVAQPKPLSIKRANMTVVAAAATATASETSEVASDTSGTAAGGHRAQ